MIHLERILAHGNLTRVEPKIRCADGFTLSVQASVGHYAEDSSGAGRFARNLDDPMVGPMLSVEVGYPSARPEPWCGGTNSDAEWKWYAENPDDPTATVYGWVPVAMVRALVALHGGEVA